MIHPLSSADWDRPLIKLRVVLLGWIAGGLFQQLLKAPVDQSPCIFGEVGVLPVSLRNRLERVARHLQPNPAPPSRPGAR